MKVALLLRGVLHKKNYVHWTGKLYEVSYKHNLDTVIKQVILPLKQAHDTDIYISTYENDTYSKNEIADDFSASSIVYLQDDGKNKQMDCFQRGLELIKAAGMTYDYIIVSRFDLDLKMPVLQIPFDLSKINFIWYEQCNDNRVGDCMHFLAYQYIDTFLSAMKECPNRTCCHYLKNYLDKICDPGDINIIFKTLHWSNTDDGENPLYIIKRGKLLAVRNFNRALQILESRKNMCLR